MAISFVSTSSEFRDNSCLLCTEFTRQYTLLCAVRYSLAWFHFNVISYHGTTHEHSKYTTEQNIKN
jgi:hypothetical protein